jgi:lipopolysaccharide biosynthesis glycosyltransferase
LSREIIITGGDAHFFPWMISAISSLRTHAQISAIDLGIIDQGLTQEQRAQLSEFGCKIIQPEWTLPVPQKARQLRNIGLVARTALRDYFPGHEVYLWFDADAWMQTPEFITAFVEGARQHGAAVVTENGPGYRKTFSDWKWWTGNMVASFGVLDGARCSFATSINIGVLCLRNDAPHWLQWQRYYTKALERTGKVNMDQHALFAAIHLGQLPTTFLPARFNWLPHLSCPVWNPEKRLLCEPAAPHRPLSVIHLAGPRKDRPYQVARLSGGTLATPLTYPAMQPHLA